MKKPIALLCSLALIIFVLPTNTHACSCVESGSIESEFERSDAVFSGKVMEINTNGFMGELKVEFDRSRIWKGSLERSITVITPSDSAACGYPFEVGKEYLVFGAVSEETGDVGAFLCSLTQPLTEASEELEYLSKSSIATNPVENTEDTSDNGLGFLNHPYAMPIFFFIVLDLIILGYLIRKSIIRKALLKSENRNINTNSPDPIQRN